MRKTEISIQTMAYIVTIQYVTSTPPDNQCSFKRKSQGGFPRGTQPRKPNRKSCLTPQRLPIFAAYIPAVPCHIA